jgi:hypothetical protein
MSRHLHRTRGSGAFIVPGHVHREREQALGVRKTHALCHSVQHYQLVPEGGVLEHKIAPASEGAQERRNHRNEQMDHGGSA